MGPNRSMLNAVGIIIGEMLRILESVANSRIKPDMCRPDWREHYHRRHIREIRKNPEQYRRDVRVTCVIDDRAGALVGDINQKRQIRS